MIQLVISFLILHFPVSMLLLWSLNIALGIVRRATFMNYMEQATTPRIKSFNALGQPHCGLYK